MARTVSLQIVCNFLHVFWHTQPAVPGYWQKADAKCTCAQSNIGWTVLLCNIDALQAHVMTSRTFIRTGEHATCTMTMCDCIYYTAKNGCPSTASTQSGAEYALYYPLMYASTIWYTCTLSEYAIHFRSCACAFRMASEPTGPSKWHVDDEFHHPRECMLAATTKRWFNQPSFCLQTGSSYTM